MWPVASRYLRNWEQRGRKRSGGGVGNFCLILISLATLSLEFKDTVFKMENASTRGYSSPIEIQTMTSTLVLWVS